MSRLDIHAYLRQRYPTVPWHWFLLLGIVGFSLAVPTLHSYHTDVPVWLLCITLASVAVLLLPVGIVAAITSVQIDIHMLFFEIAGFGSPGSPSAPLVTNVYGNGVITIALSCATAVKIGHYLKVQLRWVLVGQVVVRLLYHLVALGLLNIFFHNVTNMCRGADPHSAVDPIQFTCKGFRIQAMRADGLIWGMVGPHYLFLSGQPYV